MNYYFHPEAGFHEGDMIPGDRVATPSEIATLNAAKEKASMDAVMRQFRTDRTLYLDRLNGMYNDATHAGDTSVANCIMAVRAGLKALPETSSILAATSVVEIKAALKLAYESMLNTAIPTQPLRVALSSAFAKLDA